MQVTLWRLIRSLVAAAFVIAFVIPQNLVA
jgi:hypothetical protein